MYRKYIEGSSFLHLMDAVILLPTGKIAYADFHCKILFQKKGTALSHAYLISARSCTGFCMLSHCSPA